MRPRRIASSPHSPLTPCWCGGSRTTSFAAVTCHTPAASAALAQEGHFTTQQALDAGYSSQLLVKYLDNGKITRVRRSVYRLKHFPPGQQEDLVALWLWSERAGVFSYETALMLHELADVLPVRAHLTLPAKWRKRRLRVPEGVVLHYADVPKRDQAWVGAVPRSLLRREHSPTPRQITSRLNSSPPQSARRSRAGWSTEHRPPRSRAHRRTHRPEPTPWGRLLPG